MWDIEFTTTAQPWNPPINLQYNMLGCLDDGTNESSTKRLVFQVLFFFMISCKILCLFAYFFNKITKVKIKSFECPKSIKSVKNNDTWNIRLFVDNSFVPSSKQPSILYCRLMDFKSTVGNFTSAFTLVVIATFIFSKFIIFVFLNFKAYFR